MLVLGLFDDLGIYACLFRFDDLVDQGGEPELGLSHFSPAIGLDRIDLVFRLFLRSILDGTSGRFP